MADKAKGVGFPNLNILLSVLDPESRKLAQAWWASIPDDNPLKSELFERLFGVFKGWAETRAKGMGPLGDVVEKLTDVADFAVRGPKGSVKTAQDWMDRFFAEAGKRLEKSANPRKEAEKIKTEFELRRDLLRVIEEVRKAEEPEKKAPSIDWEKIQARFDGVLVGFAKAGGAVVRESKKADHKLARQLNRFADWMRE